MQLEMEKAMEQPQRRRRMRPSKRMFVLPFPAFDSRKIALLTVAMALCLCVGALIVQLGTL